MYKLRIKNRVFSVFIFPSTRIFIPLVTYNLPTLSNALYLYLRQFRSVYPPKVYSPTFTNVTEGPRLLHLEWNVLELHPWSVAR